MICKWFNEKVGVGCLDISVRTGAWRGVCKGYGDCAEVDVEQKEVPEGYLVIADDSWDSWDGYDEDRRFYDAEDFVKVVGTLKEVADLIVRGQEDNHYMIIKQGNVFGSYISYPNIDYRNIVSFSKSYTPFDYNDDGKRQDFYDDLCKAIENCKAELKKEHERYVREMEEAAKKNKKRQKIEKEKSERATYLRLKKKYKD